MQEIEFTKEDEYCIKNFGYNEVKDYEELKQTRQEGILFTIDCLKDHKYNFDYCLEELIKETTNLQDKLQQKENIIKEVREYNEEILKENWYGGNEKDYAKHNLEILDKGE